MSLLQEKEGEAVLDYFHQLMDEIDGFIFSGWDFSYMTDTGRMQESRLSGTISTR
jgi:hypothetical protein